jgi:hypothetical protein
MVQMTTAAHKNQAGVAARDTFVVPATLVNTNTSNVERFVSRLNSDEGLINVTLRVTGAQGLPSEGAQAVAVLNDVPLASAMSGADGLARLLIKLRKPLGTCSMRMCWFHMSASAQLYLPKKLRAISRRPYQGSHKTTTILYPCHTLAIFKASCITLTLLSRAPVVHLLRAG